MIYIGIDPGASGAIAALDSQGKIVLLEDTPTLTVKKKGGRSRTYYDLSAITIMLRDLLQDTEQGVDDVKAYLEDVHSSPQQGVVSAFSFGRSMGAWEGLLAGMGIPFELVLPQVWKSEAMHGMGTEKDASRLKARRMFPKASLHRKKDHNRADALLMAWCLWKAEGRGRRSA